MQGVSEMFGHLFAGFLPSPTAKELKESKKKTLLTLPSSWGTQILRMVGFIDRTFRFLQLVNDKIQLIQVYGYF